jgi:tetratricopeptide (TPR) repeat protein
MKRILAVYLLLFIASPAEGNGSTREWSDWVSEGKAFIRAGNYSAAAHAFRQALALAEGANADEQKLAAILDALASADAEAGQYAESEHEYRRALALTEKMEGRQSLVYALLTASLAILPTQIGNRAPVIETLREAIAVNQRTGSPRKLAIIRSCLAHILMEAKRPIEAESVLLEAQSDTASLRTTDPGLLGGLRNGLGVLRFDIRVATANPSISTWKRFDYSKA